jgi:gas vesicle protein
MDLPAQSTPARYYLGTWKVKPEVENGGHMKAGYIYAALGIAIGAVLTIVFAPKSGRDTRKWIANKCLDGLDAANDKVWRSRVHVSGIMNRGQRQVSQIVATGREAVRKNGAQSPVAVL